MTFTDLIGQEEIKQLLLQQWKSGQVPHAQLFYGPEGSGKLPMALAFARLLLCSHPQDGKPCEHCHECKMSAQYQHPDLHFVYPIIKSGSKSIDHTSFFKEWCEMISTHPWFDKQDWYKAIEVKNQQPMIYEAQGESIIEKINLTAINPNGYKIVIIWAPELMNQICANKLLKTLEEPEGKTVFLFISEQPQQLLPTIMSRLQRVAFQPLPEKAIASILIERHAIDTEQAQLIAHASQGNFIKALQTIMVNADRATYFDLFVQFMRMAYLRDIIKLSKWTDTMAGLGREKQKAFLQYAQYLIRENFIYNFHIPQIVHETPKELAFSKNFARFIHERNVIGIMEEFQEAEIDIQSNVNPYMVFFDLSMKIIILLIKK